MDGMEAKSSPGLNTIALLIKLQSIDRARDRLQRKLDEVPVKLKRFTDALAEHERTLEETRQARMAAKAEADRAELEVKGKEEEREKIKRRMNAPKLSNREYVVLQEALAGVLADINSSSEVALKALQRVDDAVAKEKEVGAERDTLQVEYEEAKAQLEGALSSVREDLARRDAERKEFEGTISAEPLRSYERVRRKHKEALAAVEGTIDRAAGRIGNDVHCSACYMAVTANDAVRVLARKALVLCKSCSRILYVP